MKKFIHDDFLLNSKPAKALYHDYAAAMPIIDYHCHINPEEIAQDISFDNLSEAWLKGDHYKWRMMRLSGEDEKYISGNESGYEKFLAFTRTLTKAPGNPVYHWAHLELVRYFDCDLIIKPENAAEIWKHCNDKLRSENMSARSLIKKSRVTLAATTDDPADSLKWHKIIAEDETFSPRILPAMRPDKAIDIEKPGFIEYINKLESITGRTVKTLDDLFSVLEARIDFFGKMGCLISDHGLDYIPFAENAETAAPFVFAKAMNNAALEPLEVEQFKTAMLLFFGRRYKKRNWVMQYHYGAMRNINKVMYNKLGPDTGFDAINGFECSSKLSSMLNLLEENDALPKTVLYSLNPNDDAILQTIAACFPEKGVASKVQHGSAWWFNDTKPGMEAQLKSLAARGLLANFIGMLTDSRSFLSYSRHEYFRRILCNFAGGLIESGEYPNDIKTLGNIIKDISYNNAIKYFGFKLMSS